MPYVTNKGARIYWESYGEGEPLVLIMGMAFTLDLWHRSLPRLTPRYRTIILDNRGVGRSDVPPKPYTIPTMTSDVAAVMDAARIESAHVLGASMGGMIAQELALSYPQRVRSLVLGCTFFGVARSKWPALRLFRAAPSWRRMSHEERFEYLVPVLYAASTPRERIDEDKEIRLANYPTDRGYYNQVLGMMLWSSYGRLPRLRVPVLIMHGALDPLIPVSNAHMLARRIRGARLVVLPDAAHFFTTDQPEMSHRFVLEFLDSVSETVSPVRGG